IEIDQHRWLPGLRGQPFDLLEQPRAPPLAVFRGAVVLSRLGFPAPAQRQIKDFYLMRACLGHGQARPDECGANIFGHAAPVDGSRRETIQQVDHSAGPPDDDQWADRTVGPEEDEVSKHARPLYTLTWPNS